MAAGVSREWRLAAQQKKDAASGTVSGDTHNALRLVRPVRCLVFIFLGLSAPVSLLQFQADRKPVLDREHMDNSIADPVHDFEHLYDVALEREIGFLEMRAGAVFFSQQDFADDFRRRVEYRLPGFYVKLLDLPEIHFKHCFHKSSAVICDPIQGAVFHVSNSPFRHWKWRCSGGKSRFRV